MQDLIINFHHLSRFLTDETEVWSQNAWDHVPPPDDQEEAIAASLLKQRQAPVPNDDKLKYNVNPSRHWFGVSWRLRASTDTSIGITFTK